MQAGREVSAAPEESSRDAGVDSRDAAALAPAASDGLEGLVVRESPRLLAYFARRVTPTADAADLLGETLLVLWRRADAVPTDPGESRMWMYGVARKVLATHRRTAVRRTALTDKLRAELEASGPERSGDDERVELLKQALAELNPLDREIEIGR